MKDVIVKLAESGWNISNGSNSALAWLDRDSVTNTQLQDAKIISGDRINECPYTNTVSINLDFPKEDLKNLLLANKLLPNNYNELEMTSKFIKS